MAYQLFGLLAKHKINVDIILQSIGRGEEKDITFTVGEGDMELCRKVLEENKETLGFQKFSMRNDVSKVSIVGSGMVNNPGIAAAMFDALSQANINIHNISTSEIKVSVLVDKADSERAVRAIHDKFFD